MSTIKLRPQQSVFVQKSIEALKKFGSCLSIAPTGSGKTIMLSALAGKFYLTGGKNILILAHRTELTSQNAEKFEKLNPSKRITFYTADQKDFSGNAVFGSVQTVVRNLEKIPTFDLLIIDEAHHATAKSYLRIIERLKEKNDDVRIFGVTATPERGDKIGLGKVFSVVGHKITLSEMIDNGYLVKPRIYTIDTGKNKELEQIQEKYSFSDIDAETEKILNIDLINEQVFSTWTEKARSRKTIIFCSTVKHAYDISTFFSSKGIRSACIHGGLLAETRKQTLENFDKDLQVITNVAVLTEGYDNTLIGCVIILRLSSEKSTLIQMIGRGLRTLDKSKHPGREKEDCIVLDFGTSILKYGSIEQDNGLDDRKTGGAAPIKKCPDCEIEVFAATKECPACGHKFKAKTRKKITLKELSMSKYDLEEKISLPPFIDISKERTSFVRTLPRISIFVRITDTKGAVVITQTKEGQKRRYKPYYFNDLLEARAFSDKISFKNSSAIDIKRTMQSISLPATAKQLVFTGRFSVGSKYEASCFLSAKFNSQRIRVLIKQKEKEILKNGLIRNKNQK